MATIINETYAVLGAELTSMRFDGPTLDLVFSNSHDDCTIISVPIDTPFDMGMRQELLLELAEKWRLYCVKKSALNDGCIKAGVQLIAERIINED